MRWIRVAVFGIVLGALVLCGISLLTVGIENANKFKERYGTLEEYQTFVETRVLPSQQHEQD